MGYPVHIPADVIRDGWGVRAGGHAGGQATCMWWPDRSPEVETEEQKREAEALARLRRMGVRV